MSTSGVVRYEERVGLALAGITQCVVMTTVHLEGGRGGGRVYVTLWPIPRLGLVVSQI